MPDGKAQRPGDVVTSLSGQTIEVINTDAEGRLVLSDAMAWTQRRYKPEVMVDLATLTGALIISLGYEYGGLFCNDDGLAQQLPDAGLKPGAQVWRLPRGAAHYTLVDPPIAELKNTGPGEGACVPAQPFPQDRTTPGRGKRAPGCVD